MKIMSLLVLLMHLNNFCGACVQVEDGNGALVIDPAATFAGVEEEGLAFGFVDHLMRVAGDDDVCTDDVLGFKPVNKMVHDDDFVVEFNTQRPIDNLRKDRFESRLFTIVIAIDTVDGRGGGFGADELACEGCDVIACVKDGRDFEAVKERDCSSECGQPVVCVADDAYLHARTPAKKWVKTVSYFKLNEWIEAYKTAADRLLKESAAACACL